MVIIRVNAEWLIFFMFWSPKHLKIHFHSQSLGNIIFCVENIHIFMMRKQFWGNFVVVCMHFSPSTVLSWYLTTSGLSCFILLFYMYILCSEPLNLWLLCIFHKMWCNKLISSLYIAYNSFWTKMFIALVEQLQYP